MRGQRQTKASEFSFLAKRQQGRAEERIKESERLKARRQELEERRETQLNSLTHARLHGDKPLMEVGDLRGEEGNAFSLLANAAKVIRRAHGNQAGDEFWSRGMKSGSYQDVLQLIDEHVQIVRRPTHYESTSLADIFEEKNLD
jgi:hypothetical protein